MLESSRVSVKLFAYLCLLYAVGIHLVQAGTTRVGNIDKQLQAADLVVYGYFSEVRSEWRGKKIFTLGTFSVVEVIKGEPQNLVNVEYLGGTAVHPRLKTPVTMRSSEGVSFRQDDEAVLLLERGSDRQFHIIGLSHGKLQVYTDPADGVKYLKGLQRIHGQQSAGSNQVTIDSKPMSLQEFGEYVRGILKSGGSN